MEPLIASSAIVTNSVVREKACRMNYKLVHDSMVAGGVHLVLPSKAAAGGRFSRGCRCAEKSVPESVGGN